jgi:hypothetical protein
MSGLTELFAILGPETCKQMIRQQGVPPAGKTAAVVSWEEIAAGAEASNGQRTVIYTCNGKQTELPVIGCVTVSPYGEPEATRAERIGEFVLDNVRLMVLLAILGVELIFAALLAVQS